MIKGHWYFGGHWMGHFGHFILETLTNLWAVEKESVRALFLSFVFGRKIQPWQQEFVDLLPFDIEVRVAPMDMFRIESVTVPSRPVALNLSAAPEALRVWNWIADAVRSNAQMNEMVFLSRSRLVGGRDSSDNTQTLDDIAASLGFTVVHPQTLPVKDQIALVLASPGIMTPPTPQRRNSLRTCGVLEQGGSSGGDNC